MSHECRFVGPTLASKSGGVGRRPSRRSVAARDAVVMAHLRDAMPVMRGIATAVPAGIALMITVAALVSIAMVAIAAALVAMISAVPTIAAAVTSITIAVTPLIIAALLTRAVAIATPIRVAAASALVTLALTRVGALATRRLSILAGVVPVGIILRDGDRAETGGSDEQRGRDGDACQVHGWSFRPRAGQGR